MHDTDHATTAAATAADILKQQQRTHANTQQAQTLLTDAECIWAMFEKLLEFDQSKFCAMFHVTGLMSAVVEPLLRRALTIARMSDSTDVNTAATAAVKGGRQQQQQLSIDTQVSE